MTTAVRRLGTLGAHYRDPVTAIDWSRADDTLPWLPPDLLSLAGLDAQARLSENALIRFSRVEFARLCAAGLWLEGLLISRVAARGFLQSSAEESRLVLQEVREESGHGLLFLEMIDRAGVADVPLLGPTGTLTWVAHRLHPNDAAFWAMVYIGESVTDAFAVKALKASAEGSATLCPVARQVLSLHHRDEARHIAAARALLESRVAEMTLLSRTVFARTIRFLLKRFLSATLYPTTAGLAAAGLEDPGRLAAAAQACPRRRSLAQACAAPALDFLAKNALVSDVAAENIGP